jgi:hypothetical protein
VTAIASLEYAASYYILLRAIARHIQYVQCTNILPFVSFFPVVLAYLSKRLGKPKIPVHNSVNSLQQYFYNFVRLGPSYR